MQVLLCQRPQDAYFNNDEAYQKYEQQSTQSNPYQLHQTPYQTWLAGSSPSLAALTCSYKVTSGPQAQRPQKKSAAHSKVFQADKTDWEPK